MVIQVDGGYLVLLYTMKDDDTRSVFSMQELEPSPVRDDDLEQADYFQDAVGPEKTGSGSGRGFFGQTLGLTGLRNGSWDSWCMSCSTNAQEKRHKLTIKTSIRTAEILDIPPYDIRCDALRQHIVDPTSHPVRA